jgi:transposase
VSYGYAKKIRRQQLQSGQFERVPQSRYVPVSRVTPEVEQYLGSQLRQQPDLTLQELAERLEQSHRLRVSRTRVWEVLKRLQWRRKKNRSTPASRTARRRSSGGKRGGKP